MLRALRNWVDDERKKVDVAGALFAKSKHRSWEAIVSTTISVTTTHMLRARSFTIPKNSKTVGGDMGIAAFLES